MKRIFTILVICMPVIFCYGAQAGDNGNAGKFRLLPAPQKVEWNNGTGLKSNELKGIFLKGDLKRPALVYPLDNLPLADHPGKGILTLEISNNKELPASNESYILQIQNGEVTISGKDDAGVFYGCQTLLQMLEDATDQRIDIPACRITDFPDIPYRAVHLDLKYHLEKMEYYYRMMDRLAGIKVNAVIIEFEDKLRYRKADKVGSGNAVSIDEFAALSRYAKERHIEISPLVQGLGHVSFILKHDIYTHLRDDRKIDWVIDPLNPETYDLHFKMYDDAMEATPGSKYLHIGGDEVYNLGASELCKRSGMKPFELQMYWLNKVCKYVTDHGRTPIFWDDMVFSLSDLYGTMRNDKMLDSAWVEKEWAEKQHLLDENVGLFPKNCIYMRWNYNFPKIQGNTKAIDWFMANGMQVWGAPAAQDMSAMLPRQNSIYQPTKDFCEIAVEKKLPGMLLTAWDDSSPHMETFWRGFYDYAGLSWNYQDMDAAAAHKIFRHRFYAPELAAPQFEFQDSLELALDFWDVALINQGHRRHYPYKMDLISLPHRDSAGIWSKKYADKVERAQLELKRYSNIRTVIAENKKRVRRNRYSLELLTVMNELQIYPSRLLLLLQNYDQAKDKDRIKKEIGSLVNSFPALRKQYEDVFSEQRFLSNPPGYILDQNNDPMLGNGTNNSDWMHVFELAFNDKLLKWLNEK
ncbi:Glycosyl hydrolase family 20, catalytic domain [Chitinophaga ginsengisegetis]|uniref:Glycosyl hydrolase family 20, catalytic domain n=1 Tax=Chitinophaga ginsengisegetis TaxID=393003 RepID=A0A1T5PBA5_9BACT|nr:family 20 glycosylhydrolase [Chitinophaga ginsengisegetis]SKD10024.1 Glycosyl hydrolase family 20, catalytic domain [Chitinophaga ginsengisegetis]